MEAVNPRKGEADYRFAPATDLEQDAVAARLRAAQPDWAARGVQGRARALLALADAVARHADAIAERLSVDTGRARIAALEVAGAVASLRGWASTAPALMPVSQWQTGRTNPAIRHRNDHHPFPLVGVISPWNFPVTLSFIDTIPALAAGCAVMVKPSEVTPRFVDALEPAIAEAGLGDVLAFVRGGSAVGAGVVERVDCVCFTGSVETGRKVAIGAARRLIPAMLELGGKDPLIIGPGADLDAASTVALRSSVLATGQACQSIERIYVHQADHDAFVAALTAKAEAVELTRQRIDQGAVGPFIDPRQATVVEAQIADAVAGGARVLCGGVVERHGGGHWMRPTVLADVTHAMSVMREETFGPVMPVMAYRDVDEAVRLANDTAFGLSAAVFAADIDAAESIGVRLNAGAVSLQDAALTNQYFEAAKQSFGQSGLGPSRMGAEGLLRFLRARALIAQTGEPMPLLAYAEGDA